VSPVLIGLLITIIFVGGLLAGSFVYWGITHRVEAKSRTMAQRLGTTSADPTRQALFQANGHDPVAAAMGFVGRHLEDLARQSGTGLTATKLATRIGIAGLGGALVMGTVAGTKGAVLGLLVGMIPWILVRSAAEQRNIQLSEQLPDALDLISRSLQAGHGTADAMRLVAEELPQPISGEFGQVYEESKLGRDFRDSMTEMAIRNPHNFDLRIVVSATLLQRETGGNLVEIFNNIAATIRARFIFKGKVRALTAEAKMSAGILGALPFVIAGALMFLRPDYLSPLITEPAGRSMLLIAGLLFISGVLLMRSLATVEA
jgi:tight adherence protein B